MQAPSLTPAARVAIVRAAVEKSPEVRAALEEATGTKDFNEGLRVLRVLIFTATHAEKGQTR